MFPEAKYRFKGVGEDVDGVRIVLEQDYIPHSFQLPGQAEIDDYLYCVLGLEKEDRYYYGNEYVAVTDVSAGSDNVLVHGGRLHFIDPIVCFKRPACEVLDYYYGILC